MKMMIVGISCYLCNKKLMQMSISGIKSLHSQNLIEGLSHIKCLNDNYDMIFESQYKGLSVVSLLFNEEKLIFYFYMCIALTHFLIWYSSVSAEFYPHDSISSNILYNVPCYLVYIKKLACFFGICDESYNFIIFNRSYFYVLNKLRACVISVISVVCGMKNLVGCLNSFLPIVCPDL
ncbi:hypothetical protein ACJX0J_029456, partial [Zea mays]